MATGSGAFSVNAGYNQSGGYLVVVSDIKANLNYYTGSSGSGGAATVGSFSTAVATSALPSNSSTLFATGRVVKDMGKTLVSSGRTFRKIQAITSTPQTSFGVTGPAAGAVDPGYFTFYVETSREGTGMPAALARFM